MLGRLGVLGFVLVDCEARLEGVEHGVGFEDIAGFAICALALGAPGVFRSASTRTSGSRSGVAAAGAFASARRPNRPARRAWSASSVRR
jgi:hypothetical protein